MDCPHCHVPLLSDVCPKCKYDPAFPDGGEEHLQWLAAHGEPAPESAGGGEVKTRRLGKRVFPLTVLTRDNLAENCRALAKKDIFWTGVIMVTVSLWITLMSISDLTKGGRVPPQVLFIWAVSAGVILYVGLTKGKTARLAAERIRLGQFRLLRTAALYAGKGNRKYVLNGAERALPRKTIGFIFVESDMECYLLMLDGEPAAVFPTARYTLGGDLEEKLSTGSAMMTE